jgi:hypothetical protein
MKEIELEEKKKLEQQIVKILLKDVEETIKYSGFIFWRRA